jgi:hypothetical protein
MNTELLILELLSDDSLIANNIASKAKSYKNVYDKKQIDEDEFVNLMDVLLKDVNAAKLDDDLKNKLEVMLNALIDNS